MKSVVIIRHHRERVSKCTLQPLINRPGMTFLKSQPNFSFDATGFILLSVNAPELTHKDSVHPLLILDSTWKLLAQLRATLQGTPIERSIPSYVKTAYPRSSKIFQDPYNGLASIEALYLALKILGREDISILSGYHWKKTFLKNLSMCT